MKQLLALLLCLMSSIKLAAQVDDYIDSLDKFLTFHSKSANISARLSGTLDLEGYAIQQPASGLIFTPDNSLFVSRLSLYLDAQLGEDIYLFFQTRIDRGFDPGKNPQELRVDEYALRYDIPREESHTSIQIGKFATIVGNWVPRRGSWKNPFITAPLLYENLTGIWESAAAPNSNVLLAWAHVVPTIRSEYSDKHLRSPVIWGPSYVPGAAVFGEFGKLTYAVELKYASLSSQPDSWQPTSNYWQHPTASMRLSYRPNFMWNFGASASQGTYLRPEADFSIPAGYDLGDYRQTVFGFDINYAWHYWQVWAEVYDTRFENPRIGNADTLAYYVEVKYKFTPIFFGALRWNEQKYGDITDKNGARIAWGRDTWRIDTAGIARLNAHMQFKLQYSLTHQAGLAEGNRSLVVLQFTTRF